VTDDDDEVRPYPSELPQADEDPELEAIIRPLVRSRFTLRKGSAELAFVERQLEGLENTRYLAQEYIHDMMSEYSSSGYSFSSRRE
jgi:hypothetical protein